MDGKKERKEVMRPSVSEFMCVRGCYPQLLFICLFKVIKNTFIHRSRFSDKRLLPYFNWHSLAIFDIISEFKQFLKVSLLEDNMWFYNVEVIHKRIFLKWLCHSNKLAFDEENSKAFWKNFWITFVKFASSQ